MRRVSKGYTLVEIIIVLAITMVLLITSIGFISNSEGHNRFSQSMRDTQSKLQDWLNDIPTGFANGTRDTITDRCILSGPGHIKFNPGGGSPPPDNGECIYLGKAIQFTDVNSPPTAGQESQIFAYTVFGAREFDPGGTDERPVANLSEAGPVPIVGIPNISGSNNVDLTETYTISGHARVKSILNSSNVASNNSHLAGFYLSFNQLLATSSGSASLRAYQYDLPGNHVAGNKQGGGPPQYHDVDDCIMSPPTSGTCWGTGSPIQPQPLTDWEICFDNPTNSDTAVITISGNGGLNVTTKLEFKPC